MRSRRPRHGLLPDVAGRPQLLAPEGDADAAHAVRILLTAGGGKPVALRWDNDANEWQPLLGAAVAVLPRWHGYGWRLEAEIPLSMLPADLCAETPQTFRRMKSGSQDLVTMHEARLDFRGTPYVNAGLRLRGDDGKVQRYPWRGKVK